MKNLSKGLCLSSVACILSLVAIIIYAFVLYKLPVVFVFLIAAVVLGAVYVMSGIKDMAKPVMGIIPWLNSVLTAGALVAGVYLMVNQIGYVIASLDTVDTILAFIIFEVVTAIAMIVNIVSSFMPMGVAKKGE
ncbi:MAG: hypothetical protein K6A23_15315 [Butyrivibrio sp.]|nr:hypothetical protein [Butyrivibrio sp.]